VLELGVLFGGRGRGTAAAGSVPPKPVPAAPSSTGLEPNGIAIILLYRTRAAAGIGGACGPGTSPVQARPRTSGSRLAMYHVHVNTAGLFAPTGPAMGLSGLSGQWSPGVRQHQPRALLEDTGLQSRPTTDGSTETPTTDAHVCANGPVFHLFSRPSPASSKLQLRT
jgi:hypothetical protein